MNNFPAGTSGRRMLAAGVALCLATALGNGVASSATFGPPLLDITRQCDAVARRNVAAMSECVVAESEARAEILSKWQKFSNAAADQCVKLGKKARKYPYTAMAKCLAEAPAATPAARAASTK